jgi:hypothetical protein
MNHTFGRSTNAGWSYSGDSTMIGASGFGTKHLNAAMPFSKLQRHADVQAPMTLSDIERE